MKDKLFTFFGVYFYCALVSACFIGPIISYLQPITYEEIMGAMLIICFIPAILVAQAE